MSILYDDCGAALFLCHFTVLWFMLTCYCQGVMHRMICCSLSVLSENDACSTSTEITTSREPQIQFYSNHIRGTFIHCDEMEVSSKVNNIVNKQPIVHLKGRKPLLTCQLLRCRLGLPLRRRDPYGVRAGS